MAAPAPRPSADSSPHRPGVKRKPAGRGQFVRGDAGSGGHASICPSARKRTCSRCTATRCTATFDSIAITAAVQLQSLARWVDLDGNLLLSHDPFAGAVMKAGRWQPPDRPGLGVKPRVSNRR